MRKDDRGGSFKKDFKSGKDRTYNNKKDFAKRDSYVEKNDTNADTEEKAVSNETENTGLAEGRNAVMEAIRSGRTVEKVFIQEGLSDGTILSIVREIKKRNILHSFVSRDRLDQMSESGRHQGVIAQCAEYSYSEIEDIFEKAKEKGEDPFIIILDEIEDPHNLGAIIRTANLCGAHGVIIPKHRAAGLTSTAVRASAGAINYTPVVKVTNISKTIEELKERGVWFACADMQGEVMYRCNLKGPIGLVIGNEGNGVSRLVKEKCDYITNYSNDEDGLAKYLNDICHF